MFDLGIQELIVIFIVALIVFGPKRLPELGKTLGKGILELKKAVHGVKEQIDTEFDMTSRPSDSIYPPVATKPKKEEDVAGGESDRGTPGTEEGVERKEETVDGR